MILIWGTKLVRRKLGLVAMACPICRDITSCELTSARRVRHLYYIPLSSGTLALYESKCQSCGLIRRHHPALEFTPVAEPLASMEELARVTNPAVLDQVEKLIQLGEQVRQGTLPPDRRVYFIADTLDAVTYMTELGGRKGRDESLQALSALGLILTLPATLIFLFGDQKLYAGIAGILAAGFLALTIRLILRGPQDMLRKTTLPLLRVALEPLNPTREELDSAVALLQSDKSPMGKWVTGQQLEEGLRSSKAEPSPR